MVMIPSFLSAIFWRGLRREKFESGEVGCMGVSYQSFAQMPFLCKNGSVGKRGINGVY